MTENEFILQDRLEVIKTTIQKYGEENFYLAFSGGKDSTVVHHLVDKAIPENKIPRVFSNTGIEYSKIIEFVRKMAIDDDRFIMLTPKVNIRKMLEEKGYPFKSKYHSAFVEVYQRRGMTDGIHNYLQDELAKKRINHPCPNILRYQFTDVCKLKISDLCCEELKEKPVHEWSKINNRRSAILGLMREEGGRRISATCIRATSNGAINFSPLAVVSHEWEKWFIDEYNIELCELYREPYNLERTGCKGCPFNINIQRELAMLEKWFPNERKQCELIWAPVYEEYRRIGYRLQKEEQLKLL